MVKPLSYKRSALALLAGLLILLQPGSVLALSAAQKKVLDSGSYYFNVEASASCTAASGGISSDQLLSLTYPTFENEPAIVAGIESTIKERYASSPWLGLGQWILDESKANNVNPLFIVATGGVESGFGDSRYGRTNNNYFGIDQGKKVFESPKAGILYFIEIVPKYLAGDGSGGRYKDAANIYEYSSIHQAGSIVYPGQPFDPQDIDSKPGVTADLWDNTMGVWISWNPEANNQPGVNPEYKGNVYNPLNYYKLAISIINKITGQTFSDTPGGPAGACSTLHQAGVNGWDLPGEGPNPMVYFSQRSSGSDAAVQGYFGGESYGPGPISYCGCGPTSWAMIVSTLTANQTTPKQVADWAASNGWQQPGDPCGGSNWWWTGSGAKASEDLWKVSARQVEIGQAEAAIKAGGLVLISADEGPFTTDGHLLVMRAVTEDGRFLFADPNDYNDLRDSARAVFNGESKSRTPLAPEQFMPSVKQMWAITRL